LKVWRLTKTRYVSTAFEGTGSRLVGGRWNSPGRNVVYTSTHPSTAVLEILVHVRRADLLRDDYTMVSADIPDALALDLDIGELSPGWDSAQETAASTAIGDEWYDTAASVALRVPSVVMRGEHNLLLNPHHPDWKRVTIGSPERLLFDSRLS